MFHRLLPVGSIAAAALFLAGCGPGKLNETRSWAGFEPEDAKAIDCPAVSKPQKLNVEFSSTEGEVSVYVFKEEDAKGPDGLIGSEPNKALGRKRSKADSFSVDVPENTATRVIVRSAAKKTDVTLKVSN
jgi:hypothetical protein